MDFEKEALSYHSRLPRGKIRIDTTKPLETKTDLSLAYSPGVAGPCREIAKNPDDSFVYTARGNLVGVVSNGTAVLGLGNIGPYASKPVMEGKAMLFKKFADIDVFDIELASQDNEAFIQAVAALEPTFGGINLEDIKAPDCFYIEERLQEMMSIPVFHDDQHGTAIIAGSAFLNACEISGRKVEESKIVFCGAGAAAIGCARLFRTLGVKAENLMMCDSKGVLHSERTDLNDYKKQFAVKTELRTMAEALQGADAFVGVSGANVLTPEMLKGMAKNPIVFALANPDPEILPDVAKKARPDVIIATGRSDFPNQVNNVLGFPYIFRGALDVRARCINEAMKLAAIRAIADLAKEEVPDEVLTVYKESEHYVFGRDYLIPKPVDQRVLLRVAPAVAKAAMDSGVARVKIDLVEYQEQVERILGPNRRMIRQVRKDLGRAASKRVVLAAGEDTRVIKAARQAVDGGIDVILLGNEAVIARGVKEAGIRNFSRVTILDPRLANQTEAYGKALHELRQRKGVNPLEASHLVRNHDYYAAMMLQRGDVDVAITGVVTSYRSAVRPLLEVVGPQANGTLAGIYLMMLGSRMLCFADCAINIDPTAEELVNIAVTTAETARLYIDDPIRVAMLSFACFGVSRHPASTKVRKAVSILHERDLDFEVDGEMHVDCALNRELREREYPFCTLSDNANVLVFPDLASANSGYKLLNNLGGAVPTGPILAGLRKSAHVIPRGATVRDIVNMIYLGAHRANMLDAAES